MKYLLGMACLLVVVLVGCSSERSDSTTEPTADTPEAACHGIYSALSDSLARCSGPAPEEMLRDFEQVACGNITKAVAAGRMGFDKSKYSACVNAIRTMTCDDADAEPAGCAELFPGKVAADGTCFDDGECQGIGTLYCANDTTCPGTCTLYKTTGQSCGETDRCVDGDSCIDGTCVAPGKSGEDCYDGARTCEAGLVCLTNSDHPTCQPKGTQGQTCDQPDACASGLTCLFNSGAPSGTCQPRQTEGATCQSASDCAAGLSCTPASPAAGAPQKCAKPKKLGAACTFGNSECTYPNSCDEHSHTCVGPAAVGADCSTSATPIGPSEYVTCKDSFCDFSTHKCTAYKAPGESCDWWDSSCEYGCGEDSKCKASLFCMAP